MLKRIVFTLGTLFLVLFLIAPPTVMATTVGTELLLLADVSGSLDTTDFSLQRDGYEAAFRDSDVINAITDVGGIAVSMVYWATEQSVAVDWTYIYDEATANAFADAIASASRPTTVGTATYLADAMNYGVDLYTNDFEGTYLVADISGDGEDTEHDYPNQIQPYVQDARDNLVLAGVDMINALWIDDRDYFGDDPEDLIQAVPYGIDNVIYGAGSFSWIVEDYSEFQLAVKDKILGAITPVPDASVVLLLGSSLMGLGVFSRKRKKS